MHSGTLAAAPALTVSTEDHLDRAIDAIGFGRFQLMVFGLTGIACVADGAEMLVLSLISHALEPEWQLTTWQKGLLGSSIFIGFLVGSLLAGKVGDTYGRRTPYLLCIAATFSFGLASAFSTSYTALLILRTGVGLSIGGAIPLSNSLFAECCPVQQRGRFLILNNLFFATGEALTGVLAWLVMPHFEAGHWRGLLALAAVPAFICFVLGIAFLPESPRYLLLDGDYEGANAVLQTMARVNGKSVPLEDLRPPRNAQRTPREVGSVSGLFSRKLAFTTLLLWPTWFVQTLVFYGMVYALPIVFKKEAHADSHLDIVLAALVEMPSVLLAAWAVGLRWMNRTRLLWMTMAIVCVSLIAAASQPVDAPEFNLLIMVGKFFVASSYSVVFPYTVEVYPTYIRATGIGWGSAFGRLGGIVTPFLCEYLLRVSLQTPFFVYGIAAGVGALCCMLLPIETVDRPDAERAVTDKDAHDEFSPALGRYKDSEQGSDTASVASSSQRLEDARAARATEDERATASLLAR